MRINEPGQTFHAVEDNKPKWLRFAFKEWTQFKPEATSWDRILGDSV